MDRILSKSKPSSFEELIGISNFIKIFICLIFTSFNNNFFQILYPFANSDLSTNYICNFLNSNIFIGIIILIVGLLSMTKKVYGRRLKLILIIFIIFMMLNIIWIIFTKIPDF